MAPKQAYTNLDETSCPQVSCFASKLLVVMAVSWLASFSMLTKCVVQASHNLNIVIPMQSKAHL